MSARRAQGGGCGSIRKSEVVREEKSVLQDLGILLMLAALAAVFLGMLDAIIRRVEKHWERTQTISRDSCSEMTNVAVPARLLCLLWAAGILPSGAQEATEVTVLQVGGRRSKDF
jgi:hypothetical protein